VGTFGAFQFLSVNFICSPLISQLKLLHNSIQRLFWASQSCVAVQLRFSPLSREVVIMDSADLGVET